MPGRRLLWSAGADLDFSTSPFFAVLRAQLTHAGERQKLVSENIANATTPGYTPRDLDEKSFSAALSAFARKNEPGRVAMAATHKGHLGGQAPTALANAPPKVRETPDSETTIDGNAVVLEEQMLKAAETRMRYEQSLALYQKGLQMMRIAVKPPGR